MKKDIKHFKKPSLNLASKRTKNHENVINRDGLQIPVEMIDAGLNKKYYLRTYGCQGNEVDGEVIAGILEVLKYEKTEELEEADIILLNTCAVRENAHNKVFGELGALKRLKTLNPDIIIGLCGCMSQEEEVVNKTLKTYPQVDLIFGTHNINRLPILLKDALMSKERVVEVFSIQGEVFEDLPVKRSSNLKAFVNIVYGCDKFCTYCIVPYTRGRERSRLKEDILNEINDLIKDGYKEVTLIGQNVNAYGNDLNLGYDFSTLLESVANTKIDRLRFVTSHPWNFSEKMISIIAKYDNIMPYIHLPVQSGDDRILKKMNRRYTIAEYKDLYNSIRSKIKNSSITTDIIVGFPGEDEEEFNNTLKLVEELEYDGAYTFIYSQREGTPASKMKDLVSKETKNNRLQILNKVIEKKALKRNQEYVGKILKVLVEGQSKRNEDVLSGYSEENKLVNFKGDFKKIGQIVKVKINEAKTWTLNGVEVNE